MVFVFTYPQTKKKKKKKQKGTNVSNVIEVSLVDHEVLSASLRSSLPKDFKSSLIAL